MKGTVRKIIYLFLFIILIGLFIYIGKKDFKVEQKSSDQERFATEYNVSKKNNFKYLYGSEVIDVIKNKKETGIIFLGFPENEWSKYYVKYLMEVLEGKNIKNCYYYNLLKDRAKYTKYYRELENLLSSYLYVSDVNTIINTPALVIIKDGNILYYDDETSIQRKSDTPESYWTYERIYNFKNKINSYLGGIS